MQIDEGKFFGGILTPESYTQTSHVVSTLLTCLDSFSYEHRLVTLNEVLYVQSLSKQVYQGR